MTEVRFTRGALAWAAELGKTQEQVSEKIMAEIAKLIGDEDEVGPKDLLFHCVFENGVTDPKFWFIQGLDPEDAIKVSIGGWRVAQAKTAAGEDINIPAPEDEGTVQ